MGKISQDEFERAVAFLKTFRKGAALEAAIAVLKKDLKRSGGNKQKGDEELEDLAEKYEELRAKIDEK